jgi:hypothetical protein
VAKLISFSASKAQWRLISASVLQVLFATPAAWRCDADATKVPGKRGVASCDRCSNTGKTIETVTINGDPHSVAPKANVLICQTQAMVE